MAFHSGFCSVIGRPNVGKSTFLNHFLQQKLSIISNKPQTTRDRIQYIYTDADMQIIFLDTPGIQIPKNELGEAMLRISHDALNGVDVCLYVMEPDPEPGRLDQRIIEKLSALKNTPIVLLLNKMDQLEEDVQKERVEYYKTFPLFKAVLPMSAQEEQGFDAVKSVLYDLLPEGPQYYPEDMITDRPERFLVSEFIREQCLQQMQEEIPHGIYVQIDQMRQRDNKDLMDIHATIFVEKESHKGMVIGKQGQKLRSIGEKARKEIETLLQQRVHLQLWVKVEKNWRKNKGRIRRLGYEV